MWKRQPRITIWKMLNLLEQQRFCQIKPQTTYLSRRRRTTQTAFTANNSLFAYTPQLAHANCSKDQLNHHVTANYHKRHCVRDIKLESGRPGRGVKSIKNNFLAHNTSAVTQLCVCITFTSSYMLITSLSTTNYADEKVRLCRLQTWCDRFSQQLYYRFV